MKPGTTQRLSAVEHLPAFVLAQAGDVPVADGDVRLEPLPA